MAEMLNKNKDVWPYDMPEKWSVTKAKYYCFDIFSGGTPNTNREEYWDGDIPWLKSGVCHDGDVSEASRNITKLGLANSSTRLIPKNTPLVAMTGATCGHTAFLRIEACANQSVMAFISNPGRCYTRMLYYMLQASYDYILSLQTGGAQAGVNLNDCRNIPLPNIPLFEQKMIADSLDEKCAEIDKLSEDIQKQIQCLVEYKGGLIHRTLLRYDRNEPVMKPIKYVATCNDESLSNNTPADYEFDYVDIGSVLYGSGITKKERMSFGNSPSRARRIVRCGDTIVSTVRTYLKAVAKISSEDLDYPTIVSTGFAVLRPKRNVIDSDYLAFVIQSNDFVSEVEAVSVGVSYPAINTSALMNIKIPLYDLTTQNKIASYLDEKCKRVDLLISAENEQLARLANYKKSIIYEYVTGKKRVKGVN